MWFGSHDASVVVFSHPSARTPKLRSFSGIPKCLCLTSRERQRRVLCAHLSLNKVCVLLMPAAECLATSIVKGCIQESWKRFGIFLLKDRNVRRYTWCSHILPSFAHIYRVWASHGCDQLELQLHVFVGTSCVCTSAYAGAGYQAN